MMCVHAVVCVHNICNMCHTACPANCGMTSCRYNDEAKKAECVDTDCEDSFIIKDGYKTCAGKLFVRIIATHICDKLHVV